MHARCTSYQAGLIEPRWRAVLRAAETSAVASRQNVQRCDPTTSPGQIRNQTKANTEYWGSRYGPGRPPGKWVEADHHLPTPGTRPEIEIPWGVGLSLSLLLRESLSWILWDS